MNYFDLTAKLQAEYEWLDDASKQAPLEWRDDVIRFKRNVCVVWAVDHTGINKMWEEASRNKWPIEDVMSYYRQMGYSLCGFGEIFTEDLINQGHC